MKKACMLLAIVLLISLYGVAAAFSMDDLSGMTDEELLELRAAINDELAGRVYPPEIEDGARICDLFPDEVLARYICDEAGLFSIQDEVDAELLESIEEINFLSHDDGLSSLEGIQYLPNLRDISCYWQENLTELPDCIGTLLSLESLWIPKCGISAIPDSVCNLTKLEVLNLEKTAVKELPRDIGNLTSLRELNISETLITALPESIYTLTLDKFEKKGLELE